MAHWFISHSTKDGAAEARSLAAAIEARGEKAWIAPRDVAAGLPYPGQITRAVQGAKGLIVVVTPAANESTDVLQEVQIANQARVKITPVIVRGTKPSDDLAYYVGVRHQVAWSDAEAVADAVTGVKAPLAAAPHSPRERGEISPDSPPPPAGEVRAARRGLLPDASFPRWAIPAGAAGLALVVLLIWSPWNRNGAAAPSPPSSPAIEDTAAAAPPLQTERVDQSETSSRIDWGVALANDEVIQRGRIVFAQCRSCHMISPYGVSAVGPNLWGVVGKPVASREGYRYSAALRDWGGFWDFDRLNVYLERPTGVVQGTSMAFAGIRQQSDRIAIIAYLRTTADQPVPLPAPFQAQ